MPCALAMVRTLQWVAAGGFVCSVASTTARTFAFGDAWHTTGTWSVLFQARQPKGQKPLSPELDRGPGDFQFPGDVLIEAAIGRHLHDLCTLHQAQWEPPATGPGGQDRLLFGGQDNGGSASHAV